MMGPTNTKAAPSPFDLDHPEAYARWRVRKLAVYPARIEDLIVEIGDLRRLTPAEHEAILERCWRANMALYAARTADDSDKDGARLLGEQLGLVRLDRTPGADEDAISSLTVQSDALHRGYIPYTDRPIAWHTDGYYNAPGHQIYGVVLHCVYPAAQGGENDLLDHEIAYLLLRDRSHDYIRALMHPGAMTIPANADEAREPRPEQAGPVFSVRPDGHLHMRYTDRKRNILWREDPLTREAVVALREVLYRATPWHFKGRLESGWGLVCNNVLHTRTAFTDGERPRLLYRARYYDRIAGT